VGFRLPNLFLERQINHAHHTAINQKRQEALEVKNQGAGFVVLFQLDP
jgi:hypothetical protein